MNELLSMGTLHRFTARPYVMEFPGSSWYTVFIILSSFAPGIHLTRERRKLTHSTPLVSHAPFVLSVILIIIKEVCMATVEKQGYFTGWTPKAGGIIAPDERLPWGQSIFLGLQHVLAMFGATVLAPIIMGFNPNTAIFFSGIGTLIFFVIVGGRVPSYLGSSFSFIAVVIAASAYMPKVFGAPNPNISVALGGIIAAGVVYAIIGVIVMFTSYRWIEYLMPPVVTGAVVAVIGLNLAPIALQNASRSEFDAVMAIVTVVAVAAVAVYMPGPLRRLPILLGGIIGYLVHLLAANILHFGKAGVPPTGN